MGPGSCRGRGFLGVPWGGRIGIGRSAGGGVRGQKQAGKGCLEGKCNLGVLAEVMLGVEGFLGENESCLLGRESERLWRDSYMCFSTFFDCPSFQKLRVASVVPPLLLSSQPPCEVGEAEYLAQCHPLGSVAEWRL